MSYDPNVDFLGLLRQTVSGVSEARMPGLDFVVAALSRTGLFRLSVGQTAPTVNQPSTAWFKPASPSYTAEGMLFLWDGATGQYEVATAALWIALLSGGSSYAFQSAASATNIITDGTSLLAVQRAAPTATSLILPNLINQFHTGRRLQIVDFSTSITKHVITLTTIDGSTIMQLPSWQLLSTSVQLAGVMLQPSPDLNSWVIAP